ncbi:MAG: hypothetical protein WCI72_02520 [archaeon]
MKHSIGYRSGNSSFLVSAVASVGLVGLFYLSNVMSKRDSELPVRDNIESLVPDCFASGDIEVYSSIYKDGSYFLIK